MSNLTIEELPTEIVDLATTPEGMERARALLIGAFSAGAEFSPEIEKQLAAMSKSERGKFIAALIEKGRQATVARRDVQVEDDPAVWASSFGVEKGPLSPEAAAALRATLDAPASEPTDAMKQTVDHWKRATGYGTAADPATSR